MITLQDLLNDLKHPIEIEIRDAKDMTFMVCRSDREEIESVLSFPIVKWQPGPPKNKGFVDMVVCLQFPEEGE